MTSSQASLHNGSYTYAYVIWVLSPIKMKLDQILVCCLTNISNMFLAQCWRPETSSRSSYDFIKMTIGRDLTIFNNWHLPFLIVLSSIFQKNETLKSWHNWLLSKFEQVAKLKRNCNLAPALPIVQIIPETIALAYIYQLTKFADLMSCGSKDMVKNAPCLMY